MIKRYDILKPLRRRIATRSAVARAVARSERLYRRLLGKYGLAPGFFPEVALAYLIGDRPEKQASRTSRTSPSRPANLYQRIIHRHLYVIQLNAFPRAAAKSPLSGNAPGADSASAAPMGRIESLVHRHMPASPAPAGAGENAAVAPVVTDASGGGESFAAPAGEPELVTADAPLGAPRVRDMIREMTKSGPAAGSPAMPGNTLFARDGSAAENAIRTRSQSQSQSRTGRRPMILRTASVRSRPAQNSPGESLAFAADRPGTDVPLSPLSRAIARRAPASAPADPGAAAEFEKMNVPRRRGRAGEQLAPLTYRRQAPAPAEQESRTKPAPEVDRTGTQVKAVVHKPAPVATPELPDPRSPEFKSAVKTALTSMSNYDFKPLAQKVIYHIEKQVARERDRRGLR